MEQNFDYGQVPRHYLHCQNAPCPLSADCLRFRAGLHIDKETPHFSIVNPAYVAGLEGECPYFRRDRLIRFAAGITHLYDTLPHAKALKIKQTIGSHFERNAYYRIRNKQRLIKPGEQAFIRQVFKDEGIEEEPVFDQYIERYDW